MVWLYPPALLALALLAIPVVLHLLARSRPRRLPFPTLRFIQPVRLASLRRRAFDDIGLLLVRAAILAAAVAAAAGPLLVTRARRAAWDTRTEQVTVENGAQLAGAVAQLLTRPPARREIVVRSPLAVGSVTAADVAAVPVGIGLRFERTGALPAERMVRFGREARLQGDRTIVERSAPVESPATRPVEVVSSLNGTVPLREAWMGDAAARITRAARLRDPFIDLHFAARADRLVVLPGTNREGRDATALVQSVVDALAPAPPSDQEIVPIPARDLERWTRAAGPAAPPTRETANDDDRRWLWLAALLLLAVEWRLRQSSGTVAGAAPHEDGASRAA